MRTHATQRGQVLIILLTTVLLSGGSAILVGSLATGHDISELKSRAEHAIADKDRAHAVRKLLDDWNHDGKAYWKDTETHRKALLDKLRRHDTKEEDFRLLIAEAQARDAQWFDKFLALRASLKAQMQPAEWQAVFAP